MRCGMLFVLVSAIAFGLPRASLSYLRGEDLLDVEQRSYLESFTLGQEALEKFPFESYTVASVPEQGLFYIDSTNDSIKSRLARGEAWEPETDRIISQYVKPGTIALDIGAHIGTHTIALSRAVGEDGVVIAFEPQAKIYRELCMNLRLNGCSNVIPVHCALGEKNGLVGLVTPVSTNEGGTYLGDGEELVSLKKLDDFKLRNISFIKMDVENYEDMVLTGGWESLMISRPVIFLEIQGNQEELDASGSNRQEKTKATIAHLEKMGYNVSPFKGCDYLALGFFRN